MSHLSEHENPVVIWEGRGTNPERSAPGGPSPKARLRAVLHRSSGRIDFEAHVGEDAMDVEKWEHISGTPPEFIKFAGEQLDKEHREGCERCR